MVVSLGGPLSEVPLLIQLLYFFIDTIAIDLMEHNVSEDGSLTVVGQTRYAPPTDIHWFRDGVLLDINGCSYYDMTTIVTDRLNSSYDVSLHICHPGMNINGNYTLNVSGLGYDTESIEIKGNHV